MSTARKLLYPFSLLYGGVTMLRNKLYDEGIFKSHAYDLPVIGVGNLSVGGTGKSPMVEYLISLLKNEHKVATLSRGYKRNTSGFRLLTGNETAAEVGDEPLQFKNKFPEVQVAVDEDRSHGIEELLKTSTPDVIILDDAFQHRKVTAGLYILLTPYGNLYSKDLILPAGNLREPRWGAKRADIVVVTKCPEDLTKEEQAEIAKELSLDSDQALFFSSIAYSETVLGESSFPLEELKDRSFTLVTGIANPQPLVDFLKGKGLDFEHRAFPDHHNFTASEVKELQAADFILTTEKDYMRLKNELPPNKISYLPISTRILDASEEFEDLIRNFV